ncbi:unnamed protein product [Closterium sp. NIES-64]|nr:unnamed protein product [Closterium sp. NIES-64]
MSGVVGTACGGKRLLAPDDQTGLVTLGRDGAVLDDTAIESDSDEPVAKFQELVEWMQAMKAQGILPAELLRKKAKKGSMAETSNNGGTAIPIPAPPVTAAATLPTETEILPSPLNLTGPLEDAAEGATEVVEHLNAHGLPVISRARTEVASVRTQAELRLRAENEDLQSTLKLTQERALDLQIALDDKEAAYVALNLRYDELSALVVALQQQIINNGEEQRQTLNLALIPSFDLQQLPRDQNGSILVPTTLEQDHLFSKKALEAFTFMTTAAPAWRMKFYPLWPELREIEKYAEAGVGKDIFYYVICMFPGKENLAMRKASERRSNYNGDIKTYGRGPGGCVPESKWKELADEGVAPQCSRSPSEWTLFYLHARFGSNWHFNAATCRPFANRALELVLLRGFGSKKATTIMVKFPAVGYALNVVSESLFQGRV